MSEVSEKFLEMKRKYEIEKEYHEKIKTRKDGRQYYIYLNRKQITASSYASLIDKLYEINSTLDNYFANMFVFSRNSEYLLSVIGDIERVFLIFGILLVNTAVTLLC